MSGSWVDTSVAGRVAVVTGAMTPTGREIATALAALGVHPCLVAPGGTALREFADGLGDRFGVPVLPAAIDVRDAAAIDRLVAHAEQRLGGVEMVVGVLPAVTGGRPVWQVGLPDLWEGASSALGGTVLLTAALVGQMVQRRHGHLVTVARPGLAAALAAAVGRDLAAHLTGTGVVTVEVVAAAEAADEAVAACVADAVRGRYDDRTGTAVGVA